STSPVASIEGQLALIENRYFFHQYSNDPVEKRLERLELLVFGATQGGSNDERLARLKNTIAERDKESAQKLKSGTGSPNSGETKASPGPNGSAQYPILNTLEWRALKKTFPQESLDQRL